MCFEQTQIKKITNNQVIRKCLQILQQVIKNGGQIHSTIKLEIKHVYGRFTAYPFTEGHQYIGIFRIVCDLHEGDKGQFLVGETLSKIIRDKDSGAVTSRHICSQDHLKVQKQDRMWTWVCITAAWHLGQLPEHVTYFPRVLRADSDTKLWSDEGVVDQASHIFKWLAIILTATQILTLDSQIQTVSMCNNNKRGQTFCRVWTDQLLSWRWGPEMWSKPGWPTGEKMDKDGMWGNVHP